MTWSNGPKRSRRTCRRLCPHSSMPTVGRERCMWPCTLRSRQQCRDSLCSRPRVCLYRSLDSICGLTHDCVFVLSNGGLIIVLCSHNNGLSSELTLSRLPSLPPPTFCAFISGGRRSLGTSYYNYNYYDCVLSQNAIHMSILFYNVMYIP